MKLYDQHLHSWHSIDSEADPADVVGRAIELGLAGVTFTEHYDTHPTEWPICRYNYDAIAPTIADLRARFADQIFIGHGIEVCYQPEQMEEILRHLATHEFDVVLVSVHWFGGRALHEREHWDGLDACAGTRAYLETVLEAVRFVDDLKGQGQRPFDVLGHLDLVKRYTHRYLDTFDTRSHAGLIDEILLATMEAGIVPEVNLSTSRQGPAEPSPPEWVMRRYVELGGTATCLGSDAHVVEHVGAGLVEAAAMLRSVGVRYQAIFKGRKRSDEPLG